MYLFNIAAKMNLNAVTVFSVLFVFNIVYANYSGEVCTAHNDSNGECILLSECDELLNMIMTAKRAKINHNNAIEIIKKSTCGFIQSEPLVCCPTKVTISDASNTGKDVDEGVIMPQKSPILTSTTSKTPVLSNTTVTPSTVEGVQPSKHWKPTSHISKHSTPKSPSAPGTTPKSDFQNTFSTDGHPTIITSTQSSLASSTSASSTQVTTAASTLDWTTQDAVTSSATTEKYFTDSIFNEKVKLLPEECGRVLSFKFFVGNRTEFDDFPWITLIAYNTPNGKQYACGGALISKRYVLTAAHCVNSLNPTWKVSGVRFGEYDTSSEIDCLYDGSDNSTFCANKPIDVEVDEQIVFPGFMPLDRSHLHDIALLRLSEEIEFTDFVHPICLPTKHPEPQRYYTSGWGRNLSNKGTNLKYMSYLTLGKQKECTELYASEGINLSEYQVCAGVKPTEKSCIGDLGGPMMGIQERANQIKRVTVFGVLSITHSSLGICEKGSWPGIYTKVEDYVPWIISQLRP